MGKGIVLDARLTTVAEMVGRCASYADVGCDHGRLGAFLLQKNWVGRALLSDISGDSLAKARRLCRLIGVEERASFFTGDGVDWLNEKVDRVVIAGMGGETIEGIVERGRDRLGAAALILQANVGKPRLRKFLTEHGYCLYDERVVVERGRCYVVMAACPGTQRLSEAETVIGPILLRKRPDGLEALKAFKLRVASKALIGARKGGADDEIERLSHEIALWEALDL